MTLRLGFLTHVTSGRTRADSLRIAIDLYQAAEALGYDTGWVAQHRFNDIDGALPAPLVFLAAAAERTTRIGLGTAVTVLPTEDPLALAEQALVVDGLSGGRLQLGVGTGGHHDTFAATGADLARKRDDYARNLTALTAALRGEPINGTAATLDASAAPIASRIWESTTSATGAQRAARNRNGLLLARSVYFSDTPTDEHQLPAVTRYLATLGSFPPRIGLSRTIYPATDRASAIADVTAGVNAYTEAMIRERHFAPGAGFDEYLRRSYLHLGHPDEVSDSLLADQIVPFATELICQTAPGATDPAKTLKALELMATEVAPRLHDRLARTPAVTR